MITLNKVRLAYSIPFISVPYSFKGRNFLLIIRDSVNFHLYQQYILEDSENIIIYQHVSMLVHHDTKVIENEYRCV